MNLGTEHKTYERAGFRNVLDEMCNNNVQVVCRMWPKRKSGLRYAGEYLQG